MNSKPEIRNPKLQGAFTLIELLVVISVIAILAGLLFTAMPAISRARALATARAELTQITTAIEAYKAKYGFYPPDSPETVAPRNPLYFELTGMLIIPDGTYRSLDGSYTVNQSAITSVLGVPGLNNSSASVAATDDRPAIESFLKDLKPAQYFTTNNNVRLLACSVEDGLVWRYVSSNPTNNPRSYDLWVDVVAGKKTNRVANWNVTQ